MAKEKTDPSGTSYLNGVSLTPLVLALLARRIENGLQRLRSHKLRCSQTDEGDYFRKALNLLHYRLQENDSDCDIAIELGLYRLMMNLVFSIDADVREAALLGFLELAKARKDCITCGSRIEKGDQKLKQILEDRIKGICLMSQADLSAAKEERQLLNSLWITFYNERSSL